MKTKVFTKNKNGKIEFTEQELKKLLDEIYDEGYNEGSQRYYYTTPYYYRWPTWYSTTCSNDTSGSYTISTASTAYDNSSIATANGGNYTISSDSLKTPKTTTATTVKDGKTYTYKVKRRRPKDEEKN